MGSISHFGDGFHFRAGGPGTNEGESLGKAGLDPRQVLGRREGKGSRCGRGRRALEAPAEKDP